jgi:hypothetical protein
MTRIGFAGYGSAPALAGSARRLAISAGAAKSVIARRRFKGTGAPRMMVYNLS